MISLPLVLISTNQATDRNYWHDR